MSLRAASMSAARLMVSSRALPLIVPLSTFALSRLDAILRIAKASSRTCEVAPPGVSVAARAMSMSLSVRGGARSPPRSCRCTARRAPGPR